MILLAPILVVVGTMQYRYNQKSHRAIESLNPVLTVPCWNCEGKGDVQAVIGRNGMIQCHVCFGIGNRRVRLDPVSQTLCTGCQGMGFVDDEELALVVACPVCEGFGRMDKPSGADIRVTLFPPAATNAPPALHLLPNPPPSAPTP